MALLAFLGAGFSHESQQWLLDPNTNVSPVADPCIPAAEVPGLKNEGAVPSYLPGENPYVNETTERYHIPVDAVMGGIDTLYPEYRKTMKDTYVAPAMCTRYCCGWTPGGALIARALKCNDVNSDAR